MQPLTLQMIKENLHKIRYSMDRDEVRFNFFSLNGCLLALFHEDTISVSEWINLSDLNKSAHRYSDFYNNKAGNA